MKRKTKRIAIWICVLILIIPCLFWGGCMVKNCILTAVHKDKIHNMQFVEQEEPLPKFDWYRITSYSDEKIEIYFVNTLGKDTDEEYKIGGKMIFSKTALLFLAAVLIFSTGCSKEPSGTEGDLKSGI